MRLIAVPPPTPLTGPQHAQHDPGGPVDGHDEPIGGQGPSRAPEVGEVGRAWLRQAPGLLLPSLGQGGEAAAPGHGATGARGSAAACCCMCDDRVVLLFVVHGFRAWHVWWACEGRGRFEMYAHLGPRTAPRRPASPPGTPPSRLWGAGGRCRVLCSGHVHQFRSPTQAAISHREFEIWERPGQSA
jgi:hypothetical protein